MKTKNLTSVYAIILMVIMSVGQAFAQKEATSFFTVRGNIVDAVTERPVAFAHVFVPGTHVGTVANLQGKFTLKVQDTLNADKIGVSHLGYKITQYEIEIGKDKESVFFIEPHSVTLQEVLVKPRDPKDIVLNALHKKNENYRNVPHLSTGFYREAIKQRNDYISIAEAVINIYQAPVNQPVRRNRVELVQGRRSADVEDADTLVLKLQGGPNMSNLLDIVQNSQLIVDEESIDFYNYELLDIVKVEDETNYVIGFEPRVTLPYSLFEGKLYITTENYAITMADFSLDLSDKDKATKNFVRRKPRRLRFTPRDTRYLVTYTKIDDKYHLNYIRSEIEFFADWRRRLFRTGYTVMLEMAVTQRESENVSRVAYRDALSSRKILADMVPVYFEDDFWGEYNYIEPDESIESAVEKLNRKVSTYNIVE